MSVKESIAKIVYFEDGTKMVTLENGRVITQNPPEGCRELVVSFTTYPDRDQVYDYDWDAKLNKWQARLF